MSKKKQNYKNSFSILEIVFVIMLLSIITTQIVSKNQISQLQLATDKIILYLNYTRYIAHIDNKFDSEDIEWEKKRWTLKFLNCQESVGGLYYNVYSDMSGGTAHYKKEDTLKDPLNNKYLYSNHCQEDSVGDKSKHVLLTQEYKITKVTTNCNTTDTIGQISFGYDGKIYSSLGNNIQEIENQCQIKLFNEKDESVTIAVEPKTGYIHKI